MNETMQLLQYIYQNSEMGMKSTAQLLDIVQDSKFRTILEAQQREYTAIHTEARAHLHKHGVDEQGLNGFEKIKTHLMLSLQTMKDKSIPHIAEMMVIGSTMGVIDAIKKRREYPAAAPEALALMARLQTFEEENIPALKPYL